MCRVALRAEAGQPQGQAELGRWVHIIGRRETARDGKLECRAFVPPTQCSVGGNEVVVPQVAAEADLSKPIVIEAISNIDQQFGPINRGGGVRFEKDISGRQTQIIVGIIVRVRLRSLSASALAEIDSRSVTS